MVSNVEIPVSICIPCFNSSHTLVRAIESALSQEHIQIEVLVVDNCSEDDTPDIVRGLANKDRRVKYIRNSENIGMVDNFNRCVSIASSDYMMILCADDYLHKKAVFRLFGELRKNPEAVFAFGARGMVDSCGRSIRINRYGRRTACLSGNDLIRKCVTFGNIIGEPSAVLFRRQFALTGFDKRYAQLLDLDMWMRLLENGSAIYLPDIICYIRRHSGQATRRNIQSGRYIEDYKLLFEKVMQRQLILSHWERGIWDARMARRMIRAVGLREVFRKKMNEVFYYPWYLFCCIGFAGLSYLHWCVLRDGLKTDDELVK